MAVFQVKFIKAKKMNVREVRQELLNELRKQGRLTANQYERTVKTWKGARPKFESVIGLERGDGNASVLTGPTGSSHAVEKYGWVDFGTKPHIIRAKSARSVHRTRGKLVRRSKMGAKLLRFRVGGFSPKTSPGVIGSRGGKTASGAYVSKRAVRHPGTKARKFTETIQKRRRQPFINAMIKAKNKGMSKLY